MYMYVRSYIILTWLDCFFPFLLVWRKKPLQIITEKAVWLHETIYVYAINVHTYIKFYTSGYKSFASPLCH